MKRLRNWWLTYRYGNPCAKHPGHRDREMDMDLLMPMCGDMCSECYHELMESFR